MTNPTPEQARKEERDAIVAWLRKPRPNSHKAWKHRWSLFVALIFWPDNIMSGIFEAAAQAIQRSDHRE